jgi:hypothetical protein
MIFCLMMSHAEETTLSVVVVDSSACSDYACPCLTKDHSEGGSVRGRNDDMADNDALLYDNGNDNWFWGNPSSG